MAKFYGEIGFSITEETAPGVWTEQIVARNYCGETIQNHRRWAEGASLNDDVTLTVKVSVIADDFITQNLPFVRYIKWHGNKFKVNMVDTQYPRIIMNLGGVYNGPET